MSEEALAVYTESDICVTDFAVIEIFLRDIRYGSAITLSVEQHSCSMIWTG